MTSSSFINSLRRFIALRGEVKLIRISLEQRRKSTQPRSTSKRQTSRPSYNPPHSSHMGGVWERLICVSRKILDSLLLDVQYHEVLTTLIAEVCSIINARPVAGVPADPDSPMPLTPSTLLTMKTTHTVDSFCIEEFTPKDIYTRWRCVQHLANCF